jgi:hypothetical protein
MGIPSCRLAASVPCLSWFAFGHSSQKKKGTLTVGHAQEISIEEQLMLNDASHPS